MYICLCNPFNDRTVKDFLSDTEEKVTVGQVYKGCSGGQSPDCCTCLDELKQIVRDHNNKVTVKDLGTEIGVDTDIDIDNDPHDGTPREIA